jgi:hypothetical protein
MKSLLTLVMFQATLPPQFGCEHLWRSMVCRGMKKVGNRWLSTSQYRCGRPPPDFEIVMGAPRLEVKRSERVPNHSPSLSWNVITTSSTCILVCYGSSLWTKHRLWNTHFNSGCWTWHYETVLCSSSAGTAAESEFHKNVRPRVGGTIPDLRHNSACANKQGRLLLECSLIPRGSLLSDGKGEDGACRSPMPVSHPKWIDVEINEDV